MRFIELSHALEDGMKAYPGLGEVRIGAILEHAASRPRYENKAEFYLGKVDMPCNAGTYIDTPFHRYPHGDDLSRVPLERLAGLPGIVLDHQSAHVGATPRGRPRQPLGDTEPTGAHMGAPLHGAAGGGRAVNLVCRPEELSGKAVLVRTGWDERWGGERYWEPGPYLSAPALDLLVAAKPALVGVDFWNVDNTEDLSRPAHTRLLAAGILIVENMANLGALPPAGFRFYAAPLRIVRGASFPVRAFAEMS
jgi:arylformamidase